MGVCVCVCELVRIFVRVLRFVRAHADVCMRVWLFACVLSVCVRACECLCVDARLWACVFRCVCVCFFVSIFVCLCAYVLLFVCACVCFLCVLVFVKVFLFACV